MSVTRQVQLVTADGRLVQAALALFSLRCLIVCFLPKRQHWLHIEPSNRSRRQSSSLPILTCGSWNTHGVTSLLGAGAGLLGRELPGLGALLSLSMASFMELFRFRGPPDAKADVPFCSELVSEFCLLYPYRPDGSLSMSSPKKPCSFFENLPPMLPFDPWDEMVVALAIDGRLSSPSPGKPIPPVGAHPGDT